MQQIVLNNIIMRMRFLSSVHKTAASNKENTAVTSIHKLVIFNQRISNMVSKEDIIIAIISENVIANVNILCTIHKYAATAM